jgi:hypothetical protein
VRLVDQREGAPMQKLPSLLELLRTADHESADMRQLNFKLAESDRVLLQQAAETARCSQGGLLRGAVRLVLDRVARRWGTGRGRRP